MASKQEAIDYAQREVSGWVENTEDVFLHVRNLHEWGYEDRDIIEYLTDAIESGAGGSGYLMSSGEGEAAFGDADGVTFDDIDWKTVIDDITDRTEGE